MSPVIAPARPEAMHWVTGNPLWAAAATQVAAGDQAAMRRPALLRFSSDDFMDDLAAALQKDPPALESRRATPVSYRLPPSGAPDGWQPATGRLKLFQPFHGQYNLVAASLVCRLAGLPDHTVRPADAERVGFVLRRLAPSSATAGASAAGPGATAGQAEMAWSAGSDGSKRWVPLAGGTEDAIAPGEELFPMFPVAYDAGGRPRRLWAGLVPTSSRETFRLAGKTAEPFPGRGGTGGKPDVDPRWNLFDVRVMGPLGDLQAKPPLRRIPADLRADASAFVLLDFADLLRHHLPDVWQAMETGTPPALPAEAKLYQALRADAGVDWRGRLLDAAAQWAVITGEEQGDANLHCDLSAATIDPAALQALFRAALPGTPPPAATPPVLDVPKLEPTGEALYVIRCMYLRPRCPHAQPASAPTVPFSIAPVLDPDAPARPIRIPMPVDTGIKDLRKFPKSVGFMLSNQLRGQMNRVTDMKKAMDGDIGAEEDWDLGVICQFSLPIIMMVALMLLIVIVFLLNIVFFWVPFFRICIPVPLRSKS